MALNLIQSVSSNNKAFNCIALFHYNPHTTTLTRIV